MAPIQLLLATLENVYGWYKSYRALPDQME